MGPILFLLIFNIVQFFVRWYLMHWSYELGTKAVSVLTANAKEFTHAASILGIMVVGALTCNYGATSIRIQHVNGDAIINVQGILDGILPMLVPLALTLLVYFLIKKFNFTAVKCIVTLLIVGIVGCAFGIWDW